jgi:pyrroline-5-carboxylate reductase
MRSIMSEHSAASGKIVVIGFGNMGQALVNGLTKTSRGPIVICDKFRSDAVDGVIAKFPNQVSFLDPDQALLNNNNLGLNDKDTVLLAVKPQNLVDAAQVWKPVFFNSTSKPLVVSILAGTPIGHISKHFEGSTIARAMPNIAATVDCAATALCLCPNATDIDVQRAQAIFDSIGKTWIVPEHLMNAVTGLSGSGPAYIYMVIEALSDGGVKMGMPRKLALELASQTVLGAAKLVQETGAHPAVLRDQVTTPGGTTISAIHELERHGLRPMLISAVVTATKRSRLLAKAAEKNQQ